MLDTAHPKPKSLTPLISDWPSLLRIHRFLQTRTTEIPASTSEVGKRNSELEETILARIESRLPGRLRHLSVSITKNAVVLTGQCCTFYTKQLAQHIAMGVLEYEQLINNIDVQVAK